MWETAMSSNLSPVGDQSSHGAGSYSRSSNTCTRFTKYCAETRIAKGLFSIYQRVVGSPNPALPANLATFHNEYDKHKGKIQSKTSTNATLELSQDSAASLPTTPSRWHLLTNVSLEQVADFLTPNELISVILVCKNWASIINQNDLVWSRQAHRAGIVNPAVQCRSYDTFLPKALRMISQYDGRVIENAKQTFANPHPAIAFGSEEYIRSGIGDPGKVPPLPSNIHEILQRPCPFWSGKTIEETHTLVLIPQTITRTVDGRPFTVLFTLRTLPQLLRRRCRHLFAAILETHGDTPVGESHWVLMTNDVIPGSRNRDYHYQKWCVEGLGYEVSGLLNAATSILLERIRSGERLFRDDPWTYTRCKEAVLGRQSMICRSMVGDFTHNGGLAFDLFPRDDLAFEPPPYPSTHTSIGVAALRKFSGARI